MTRRHDRRFSQRMRGPQMPGPLDWWDALPDWAHTVAAVFAVGTMLVGSVVGVVWAVLESPK